MFIGIISDLHVDQRGDDIHRIDSIIKDYQENKLNLVVIAGDIANNLDYHRWFVDQLKNAGLKVFDINGNHEYYNHHAKFEIIPPDNLKHEIHDGIHFIGNSGWYDWNAPNIPHSHQQFAWQYMMNDRRLASEPETMLKIAKEAADALDAMLSDVPHGEKAIVATHTIPHNALLTIKPDPDWNALNGSYYNSRMEKVLSNHEEKIKIWAYGHTHLPSDRMIGNVRFICNPVGYSHERRDAFLAVCEI